VKEAVLFLKSEDETIALGRKLGVLLLKSTSNYLIGLIGPLGAGKTTFTKGIAEGLKARDYVESPTFVFLNIYNGDLPLYHYDLYRVNDPKDLDELGIFEMVSRTGVHVIEWGDKVEELLDFDMEINFEILESSERKITIKAFNLESVLNELSIP
jgi:tRNA threonylcarbamoyladenosine biosynthesis protein TsaE